MKNKIRSYRLLIVKLGFVIFLLFFYFLLRMIESSLSLRAYPTVHFSLTFPLPQKFASRVPSAKQIPEKVILAGFFSDWNPNDESYRMKKSSSNTFELNLRLPPGHHQYKYVLYYSDLSDPVWVEDWKNPNKADDQFGGYNSVVFVYSPLSFIKWIRYLVFGVLILFSLYSLLIPVLRKVYQMRVSFKVKMALATLLIILIQSAFLYVLEFNQKKSFLHLFFVEPTRMIHRELLSEGVDFLRLDSQKKKIKRVLKQMIWPLKAKIENNFESPRQSFISGVVIYNRKLQALAAMNRKENEELQAKQMEKLGIQSLEEYLDREFFRDAIRKMKIGVARFEIIPIRANRKLIAEQGLYYKMLMRWFPYKAYLIPMVHKNQFVGYYGLIIHPYVFAKKLRNQSFIYLFMLIVTLFLSFLLSYDQGGVVIAKLLLLKKWTDAIKRGEFNRREMIISGDEIEDLSFNFDQMRMKLRSSIKNERERLKELEEIKKHLQDLVEERTEKLTKTVEKLKYNEMKIENELNFASAIQRGIMPSQEFQWGEFQFCSYSQALQKIGGDFLDIIETREGDKETLSFYISDVSGHGISSAFITALLKSSMISIVQEKLEPLQVMRTLNTKMQIINSPDQNSMYSHYLTMIYVRLQKNGHFEYANCAHPQMLIYRRKIQAFDESEVSVGTVIGILDSEMFKSRTQANRLEKGDMLFLYTDGLIEQRNEAGQELEEAGLKTIILENIQKGYRGISLLNQIIRGVRRYAGKAPVKDDVSLLILERSEE